MRDTLERLREIVFVQPFAGGDLAFDDHVAQAIDHFGMQWARADNASAPAPPGVRLIDSAHRPSFESRSLPTFVHHVSRSSGVAVPAVNDLLYDIPNAQSIRLSIE